MEIVTDRRKNLERFLGMTNQDLGTCIAAKLYLVLSKISFFIFQFVLILYTFVLLTPNLHISYVYYIFSKYRSARRLSKVYIRHYRILSGLGLQLMASNLYDSYVYFTFPTLQICKEITKSIHPALPDIIRIRAAANGVQSICFLCLLYISYIADLPGDYLKHISGITGYYPD